MSELDTSDLIFSIPARVLRPDAQRQADLLAIIKDRHVLDESILSERTPFFWEAEISSDLIDSHFTHMLASTLTNFRDDARSGVSFLPAHDRWGLAFGRSLDAMMEETQSPIRTRVVADFYTLPGLSLNGVKTDDLIDGLRSGILHAVSVGFYGGSRTCDICGRDYWSWDCMHIPGLKYEIKEGDVVRLVLATVSVDNARLAEVSSVFAGSTPHAEVLKAERMAMAGMLKPDAIRVIEQRYRIQLPAANRAFAGTDVPTGQKPREEESMNAEQFSQLTSTLIRAGVLTEDQRETVTEAEALAAADKLAKRVADLEPQASEGRQYRADLVAEALAEGVRAYGKDFDEPTYKATLEASPLAAVKRMRDDWKRIGDARLPAGRTSNDGDPSTTLRASDSLVPDFAYRS